MTAHGMLSIIRRGTAYHVHYASSDPYSMDAPPELCPDEGSLIRLLQAYGLDPGAIQQASAELRHGRMAVLSLVQPSEPRPACAPCIAPTGIGESYV